jgi:hypothetical protein
VPEPGESIIIKRDATTMFGGIIEAVEARFIDYPDQTTPHFSCRLVDYSWILDRRRLAGRFYDAGLSLNAVVFDVWLDFLNAEGMPWNTSYVDTTVALLNDIESNTYETIAQFFTRLANLTGRQWWVDADKYIHFDEYAPASADAAPINIGATLNTARDIVVRTSRTQYRNRQWVRAGVDLVNSLSDTFTATAGQDLFVTTYRMDAVVGITIDGTAATFGTVAGLYDFSFTQGSDGLYRDQHAEFTGGEDIVVEYQPPASNVISAQDNAEIAARAAIEGGTGLHEAIDEMSAILSQGEAEDYAEGMLRRFGSSGIPIEVQFETDSEAGADGIVPGQKINVNIANLGISNTNCIISDVTAKCVFGDHWIYNCTAVRSEALQSWDQYLNRVVEIARRGPDAATVATSTSGGGGYVYVSWHLGAGGNIAAGVDVAGHVPIEIASGDTVTPVEVVALSGNSPAVAHSGASVIIDVNLVDTGVSPVSSQSIFDTTKLVIPAGAFLPITQAAFSSPVPVGQRHDYLTLDIDQVGSTLPGRDIIVVLKMRVN